MWNSYKQEVPIFTCHSRFSLGMWRSQVPLLHRWSWLWQLCAKEIFLFAEKWILFPTQKRSWQLLPSTTTNPYKWERIFRFYDGQTSKFVLERLAPDMKHCKTQIPKLETFWRICILPEILGRWYTRKMDLKAQLSLEEVAKPGDCYCRETTSEAPITCANHTCKIFRFHPSCLGIKNVTVPKMWYCPHCRKLPQFTRAKSKKIPKWGNKTCNYLHMSKKKSTGKW